MKLMILQSRIWCDFISAHVSFFLHMYLYFCACVFISAHVSIFLRMCLYFCACVFISAHVSLFLRMWLYFCACVFISAHRSFLKKITQNIITTAQINLPFFLWSNSFLLIWFVSLVLSIKSFSTTETLPFNFDLKLMRMSSYPYEIDRSSNLA